jgi:hypothetical protein
MIEIRTSLSLQRFEERRWHNIGGEVIARVDAASLSGADLRGLKLGWADLDHADLSGADLSGADLGGADLSFADLTGACVRGADLVGANLRGASLEDTDLSGAILALARLEGADLRRASVMEARLRGCHFDETTQWPEGFDPWEHGAGPSEGLEQSVREMMATGLSPEEYAARHGHLMVLCGGLRNQFRDAEVTRWARRLVEVLESPRLLARCRRTYLTPNERAERRRVACE